MIDRFRNTVSISCSIQCYLNYLFKHRLIKCVIVAHVLLLRQTVHMCDVQYTTVNSHNKAESNLV